MHNITIFQSISQRERGGLIFANENNSINMNNGFVHYSEANEGGFVTLLR